MALKETDNLFEGELATGTTVEENVETIDETEVSGAAKQSTALETPGFSDYTGSIKTHDKIGMNEVLDTDILTIESIEISKLNSNDKPLTSEYGQYYKKKLIVNFKETLKSRVDEVKLRELMSSVMFPIKDGKVQPATMPKTCSLEDLDDSFTSEVSKLKAIFYRDYPEFEETLDERTGKMRLQSALEFVNALIGKKLQVKKEIKKYKDADNKTMLLPKLVPVKFIK